MQIYSARLDAATHNYAELEPVRPGLPAPVSVSVTSSSPAVGTITTSPLSFGANAGTQSTQFDPLAAGTSTVAVATPTGFDTPNDRRQITATVSP
jgi:hypothetical protein